MAGQEAEPRSKHDFGFWSGSDYTLTSLRVGNNIDKNGFNSFTRVSVKLYAGMKGFRLSQKQLVGADSLDNLTHLAGRRWRESSRRELFYNQLAVTGITVSRYLMAPVETADNRFGSKQYRHDWGDGEQVYIAATEPSATDVIQAFPRWQTLISTIENALFIENLSDVLNHVADYKVWNAISAEGKSLGAHTNDRDLMNPRSIQAARLALNNESLTELPDDIAMVTRQKLEWIL